jgi:hypothetical protein
MAEFGLFIGWGASHPGKEMTSLKVFEEAAAYWGGLQAAGEIESVETVLLGQHGGDLSGFALLRGDPEKLGRLAMSPDFQRLTMRATAVVANVGVIPAWVDAGVTSAFARWQEVIADLV